MPARLNFDLSLRLLVGALLSVAAPAQAQVARPAAATTTLSFPWGDTPIVLRVAGAQRWAVTEEQEITPVGAEQGALRIRPEVSLREEEGDELPSCEQQFQQPPDGWRPVPRHPAVPTGGAWHSVALDSDGMVRGCFNLADGSVTFLVQGATPASLARARPVLAAFAEAAGARWGAPTRAPE